MRAPLALIAALLTSCTGDGGGIITTTPGTLTADTGPPTTTSIVDTGYSPGDQGSIVLSYNLNTDRAAAYGFFAESTSGTPNLAECAAVDVVCYPTLPNDLDELKDFDPRADFEPDAFDTRYIGLGMGFGPYELDYLNAQDGTHSFYYADITEQVREEGWATGWMGPSWGADGMWQAHEDDESLFVTIPVELQRPAMGSMVRVPNGTKLPIEWVPTGDGELYLRVSQRFGIGKLWRLNDDGYFELDIDELGFGDSPEDFTVTLMRWNRSIVRRKGHDLDIAALSFATFDGAYFNIGNREPFDPADDCVEALGQAPLAPGSYWGFNGSYTDTLDGAACISPDAPPTLAKDQVIKVEIGPKQSLTADLTHQTDNTMFYAIDSCGAYPLCVTGVDELGDVYNTETLQTFNGTEDPITRYIVLDGEGREDSIFTFDLRIDQLTEPEGYDSCTESQAAPAPLAPGTYYGEFTAWSDTINPGNGGCTGTSLPGPEVFFPIEVPAGTSLNVSVQTTGADIGIYLLRNCADPFSTPTDVCSDVDLGEDQLEALSYTNVSGADEQMTLVIDSKTGLQPYFLAYNIF